MVVRVLINNFIVYAYTVNTRHIYDQDMSYDYPVNAHIFPLSQKTCI